MAGTFLRRVEGLEPGDHACLVYDSEERRESVLLRFLMQGLGRGERTLYLARTPRDPIVARLRAQAAPEQLAVLPSEECYLHEGMFDPDRALEGFRTVIDEAAALGFSTVRSAGGPPPAVTDNGASARLPSYERGAATLFCDGQLAAVCAYDARRVPAAALLGIIDAHPIVLYALGADERLRVFVDDETSLAPTGWLDLTTLGGLTGPLGRAVRSGGDVSVDLRRVDFVDVACLRLFVEAARELHSRGRRLTLSYAPAPVPAMLDLLGFDEEEGLLLE